MADDDLLATQAELFGSVFVVTQHLTRRTDAGSPSERISLYKKTTSTPEAAIEAVKSLLEKTD